MLWQLREGTWKGSLQAFRFPGEQPHGEERRNLSGKTYALLEETENVLLLRWPQGATPVCLWSMASYRSPCHNFLIRKHYKIIHNFKA